MRYFILQDDPDYIRFCENEGLEPWDEDSEVEYKLMLEDRYTNPHA